MSSDRIPDYWQVLDGLLPLACHVVARYVIDPVETDHGRSKAWLRRSTRGLKQLRSVRVISIGHALVQNGRRGCYEPATEVGVVRGRSLSVATIVPHRSNWVIQLLLLGTTPGRSYVPTVAGLDRGLTRPGAEPDGLCIRRLDVGRQSRSSWFHSDVMARVEKMDQFPCGREGYGSQFIAGAGMN